MTTRDVEITPLQKALIEQVRYLMVLENLTQKELARRVGLSEKHVSHMLSGRAQGTLEAWQNLLEGASRGEHSDTRPEHRSD